MQTIADRSSQVSESEWSVFELIGLDVRTRDIAKLLRCKEQKVYAIRQRLGQKLGLIGAPLTVTAVKSVWIQEHDESHPHISKCYLKLNPRKTTP